MAYSYITAVSDGTLKSLPITFSYMKIEDIVVHKGIERQEVGVDYTISNNIITFKEVVPEGVSVAIDRTSQRDSLRVDFTEGATFSRDNMDDVLTQLLYLSQEAMEGAVDRISPTGVLDLAGNRIINLGDPIYPQDAVPLHLVVDAEKSVYASEAKCKQYRDEALGYKDAAFTSADKAYASELNAKKSEDNAKESEINAANSASSILGAVEQSAESAAAAKVSETNAKESEVAAKDSADIAAAHSNTVVDALAATGNVPVGTIAMMANNASEPPAGWLFCGTSFNTTEYPELARLFPNGQIPSFDNRFPIGAGSVTSVGAHGDQAYPIHEHDIVVQGAVVSTAGASHINTSSAGDYSGTTQSAGEHSHTYDGYQYIKKVNGGGDYDVLSQPQTKTSSSSGTHAHTFSVPRHTHTVVVPQHNHSFTYHGKTEYAGSGDRVLPYNIGVKYIIKAYQGSIDESEAMELVKAYDLRIVKVEEDVAKAITDMDKAIEDASIATAVANEATTLANKAVSDANIAITTADESVALANKAIDDVNGYTTRIDKIETEQLQVNNSVSSLEGRVTVLEQSGGGSGGSDGSGGSGGGGANEPWTYVEGIFQAGTDTVNYYRNRYTNIEAPLVLNYCRVLWRWEDDRKSIRIKGRLVTRELYHDSPDPNDSEGYRRFMDGYCPVLTLPVAVRAMANQYFSYSAVCGNFPLDIRADPYDKSIGIGVNVGYTDAYPEMNEPIPAMDIAFDWTVAVDTSGVLSEIPSLLIEDEHYVPPPVDRPEGMVPTPPVSYLLNKIAALEASLNEIRAKDATTMLPESSQGDIPQDPVK